MTYEPWLESALCYMRPVLEFELKLYSSIRLMVLPLNSQLLKFLVKPSQILMYSKEVEERSLKYGN